MRTTFVKTLLEAAKQDKRIILLSGDLGFSVLEKYIADIPDQFLNCGLAEQNLTGVAAGLALEGYIPFIYSIAPFVTMRNFEQIRNDISYQNLNVKIVGLSVGFTYGAYGYTHHALEDIGILRTLSNITIICPGDPIEVEWATKEAIKVNSPVYLRIGRAGEPVIHRNNVTLKLGKGVIVREGNSITLMATSTLLARGLEVADKLEKEGLKVRLISMHTIKPIDEELIIDCAKNTGALFTLEEHNIVGGLGSAVSEVLAESGKCVKFKRLGVKDSFTKQIGTQEFMRAVNGLDLYSLIRSIKEVLL